MNVGGGATYCCCCGGTYVGGSGIGCGGMPGVPGATPSGFRMIRYSGRPTMQMRNVRIPHPVAFMGRFFASVYTQYPATAPTTN